MKKTLIMIAIAALQLIAMPAVASAQQVGLPNYVKALGLKDGVKYTIGAYTDDYNISYNYCTYELDLAGHLVSYSEAETAEGAYTWTADFDSEGLPTHVETVFIDYWSDPDANGNPPVTTTQYVVKRERNGSKLKIVIDEFNNGVQATITRDDKGRIIEVENLKQGEVHRYRYPDGGNVPYDLDGKLAFPQVDMFAGDHVDFPTAISISDNPTTFTHGSWEFEVFFKIGENMLKPSAVREGWKQRTITVPGQTSLPCLKRSTMHGPPMKAAASCIWPILNCILKMNSMRTAPSSTSRMAMWSRHGMRTRMVTTTKTTRRLAWFRPACGSAKTVTNSLR